MGVTAWRGADDSCSDVPTIAFPPARPGTVHFGMTGKTGGAEGRGGVGDDKLQWLPRTRDSVSIHWRYCYPTPSFIVFIDTNPIFSAQFEFKGVFFEGRRLVKT